MKQPPGFIAIDIDIGLGDVFLELHWIVSDVFHRFAKPRLEAEGVEDEEASRALNRWNAAAASLVFSIAQKQADRNHNRRLRPLLMKAAKDEKTRQALRRLCEYAALTYIRSQLEEAGEIKPH